jgi:hypothetical protein
MQTALPAPGLLLDGAIQDTEVWMSTLTLHIPRLYNPDEHGRRKKCELSKLKLTLRELRRLFSGYSVLNTRGWNQEDRVRDSHYRFEMDFVQTPDLLDRIRSWRRVLEVRFEQHAIYMRCSEFTRWL